MTIDATELTQNGYRDLREAVAQIIAGPSRRGITPPVNAEHRQAAEHVIDAGVINIAAVLPEVQ